MNSEPIHNILRTYYPLNNLLKRTDSKEWIINWTLLVCYYI